MGEHHRPFGRRIGVPTDTAPDGREALPLLREKAYALVLCDVRMPGLDGPSLLQQAIAEGLSFPTWVFLTGYSDTPDAALLGLGAWKVLGKPVELDTLLALLTEAGIPTSPP